MKIADLLLSHWSITLRQYSQAFSIRASCALRRKLTALSDGDSGLLCNRYKWERQVLPDGEGHAWKKCRIWESYSWETLLLEGNICNFEGKFINRWIFWSYFFHNFLKICKKYTYLMQFWPYSREVSHFFQPWWGLIYFTGCLFAFYYSMCHQWLWFVWTSTVDCMPL